MYSGVSRKYLSAFGKKFRTFSEKALAPGDCGSLISAGRGAGLSHSIFCGALHPAQVSVETVSITAKRSDLVLCFNEFCIVFSPLVRSCHGGLKLRRLHPRLPLGSGVGVADDEADDTSSDNNERLAHSSLRKSSASALRRRVSPGSTLPLALVTSRN